MGHPWASELGRQTVLDRAFEAAQEGDWKKLRRFLPDLSGVPLTKLPDEGLEFLLDLFFWYCSGFPSGAAFPCFFKASGSRGVDRVWCPLLKKFRKVLSRLPASLEARSYPLAVTAALGVPVPRSFGKVPWRTLWRHRFRILRRRLVEIHRSGQAPNDLRIEEEGLHPPATLSDLAHLWAPARGRPRLPFRQGRFLRMGRLLGVSLPRAASRRPPVFPGQNAREAPEGVRRADVRRRASVESWGVLGPGAVRFLDELVEAVAEELRAVRRLAEGVSRARRRVVLSLHNAASAACSGWAFEDVDRQLDDAQAAELFLKGVRDRLIYRKGSQNALSEERMLQRLWVAWQERLIKPKALHGVWEAWGRCALGAPETFSQAVHAFRDLFPTTPVHAVAKAAPLAWSGWVSPHQQVSWPLVELWRREKKALWFWGFRCLKALLQEAQDRLDAGSADALVVPWIDKFFISSRRENDLGYLRMLLDWIRIEGLSPIILFWEDTTRTSDPTLTAAMRNRWPPANFMGFGVFGDGSWTRGQAEAILTRTAEPGRLYVLRPLDDTHRPHSVEAVLQGRADRREFFSMYDSSWKDGTYAFYTGTQAALLTSIATESESIPPWVVTNGLRRPLGWYFRRAVRQRALKGEEGQRPRPLTMRFYGRFANLL